MSQRPDSADTDLRFSGESFVENQFVQVLRALPVSVAHTDRELRYTWIYNPAGNEIIDAAIGKRLSDVVPTEGSRRVMELKRQVLETGERIQIDFTADHDDGTHTFRLSVDPLYEGNEIVGVSTVTTDLTPTLRAQSSLVESEERFFKAFIASPDPLVIGDAEGRFVEVNEAFEKTFGYTREEALGRTSIELQLYKDPADRDRIRETMQRDGYLREFDVDLVTKTGDPVRGLVSAEIIEIDRQTFNLAIFRDITERKRAEDALRESEMRANAILETTVDAVVTIDSRGTVQSFNRAAERLFQYRADEVVGRNVKMLMPSPWADEHDTYLDNYRRTGEKKIIGVGREVEAKRKDESTFPIELAVSEVDLGDRRIFTGVIRDISDRKRAEAALRESEALLRRVNEELESRVQDRTAELVRANRELEERNRELQSFAYVASHDMQEPLRKIQTFADLIQNEYDLSDDVAAYMQRLQKSAVRMSQLLNDILDFSRVTARPSPFTRVQLREIVETVLEDLQLVAGRADASIEVDVDVELIADESQIRQLINHLVMNALKYCREGVPAEVHIQARREMVDGEAYCRITVADNGIGFDMRYAERIFDPFERLHERGAYPGTGMGLTICRRIVHRHGGTISAESRPGEGSCFMVILPVSTVEKDVPARPAALHQTASRSISEQVASSGMGRPTRR